MACSPSDRARRSTAFRARPWFAAALTAALAIACVEGPTEPGRFGELRIRPSYAAADGPTELGFALDSARVRIARASNLAAPLSWLVSSPCGGPERLTAKR